MLHRICSPCGSLVLVSGRRLAQAWLALTLALTSCATFPLQPEPQPQPTPVASPPEAAPPASARPLVTAPNVSVSNPERIAPMQPAPPQQVSRNNSTNLNSAYVRDVDLGNGRRQASVSQTPLNYQAEDGAWQPIDPRFTAVPRGFVNATNSFEISAGDRAAVLGLRSGDNLVGWEAQDVALTTSDGSETVLARRVDTEQAASGVLADGGRTIRYPRNWSLPGLVEEITSSPGQAEHNLVFAALPAQSELGASRSLTLRATLRLLPGERLYAGGQAQIGAFATDGTVDIRDAQGDPVLVMAPARAYEQARPSVSVAAHYRFTPQAAAEGEWQVAVDTPWDWWADPARAYPVVLDPAFMVVLQAMDIVDIYSLCASGSAATAVPPAEIDYKGSVVGVGRTPTCGAARTLLRFKNLNQLTLPPGSQIERAELVVVPVYGYYTPWVNEGTTFPIAAVDTQAHWISSDWNPGTVSWDSRPAANTIIETKSGEPSQGMWVWEPGSRSGGGSGGRWLLQTGNTGPVRQWLEGGANLGVQLSSTDESECRTEFWGAVNCHFVGIPSGNAWSEDDKSDTAENGLNKDTSWTSPFYTSGGFQLHIIYAPPALQNGVSQKLTVFPAPPASQYLRTYHSFAVPSITSWMVVGVKGFNNTVPAGSLDLSYQTDTSFEMKSTGDSAKPNYLLLSSGAGSVVDVHATTDMPAAYRIEARGSTQLPGNPTFHPYDDWYTHTFTMTSTELFRVFDLNLVENSKVSIDISSVSKNVDLAARVSRPGVTTYRGSSDSRKASSITLGSGETGKWALIVEYQSNDASDNVPFTFQVTLVIKACPPNSNPVPGPCKCELIEQPTIGTTPTRDVGSFRIYAKNGFDTSDDRWMTTSPATGCVAPMVGWRTSTTRLIALGGAPVTYYSDTQRLEGESDTVVALFMSGSSLDVWKGNFKGYPHSDQTNYGLLVPSNVEYLGELLDRPDLLNSASLNVSVQYQRVEGKAQLDRPIEVSPGVVGTQTFDLTFQVYAEGVDDASFHSQVVRTAGSASAEVAGLTLHFGPAWTIDFDTQVAYPGQFTSLRNQGTIVQPDNMGGAWKDVQAVILSRPASNMKPLPCLGGYCLEPRATNDTLAVPRLEWDMPDITIGGVAGTVMAGSPGALTVYSVDHPDGASAEVPFSLRTFSGKVKVYQGECPATERDPGSGNVTVIEGETNLALPGLGSDTEPSLMISTTFKLCQNKLRGVSLAFSGQPGLPVGNTGVYVYRVQGTVTLDPGYTTVQLRINYQSGTTGDLVDGDGTVTIDTRGLFDLQATGKVVGVVDYDGHLWVAWNPLDVGVDVKVWYLKPLLSGQVRAHLWKGQGWQHKYPWLPDNDETHFAASINAELRIEQGMAFSWWWVDIPPSTWTFGVELAFGQFCTNANCTTYEWGIKGTFSHPVFTLGYEVGVYIGMDTSLDFILGSDGHVLIDQYAGGRMARADEVLGTDAGPSAGRSAVPLVNGRPGGFAIRTVADPAADVVTEPLTVTADTGSFVAGLSWDRGAPKLTLIRPDAQEITPANAAANGVNVMSSTGTLSGTLLYGVPDPMDGIWLAVVSNAAITDNYHLVYFANKKLPSVTFTKPALDESFATNQMTYTIEWRAPSDSPLSISLYYSITGASVLSPDQKYGGVIVEHLPITATQFDWNLSYLMTGRYQVYALVSDPKLAASGYLTQSRPYTLSAQAPNVRVVHAPGEIIITDATPPVVPTLVITVPVKDAMITCWDPNPDHDLSGYVVEYRVQDWQGGWTTRSLRVHAAVPYPPPAEKGKECARINGLNGGNPVAHRVAAYDASGNLSKYTNWMTSTVSSSARDTGTAAKPGGFTATLGLNRSVVLTWTGSLPACGLLDPCTGAFWLYYAPEHPAGPGQTGTGAAGGRSPIKITQRGQNTHQYTVEGLPPGYRYSFAALKQDDQYRRSELTAPVWVLVTDGVDSNGNGMPDDWEGAHGVTQAGDDPDLDGCTNLEEYRANTDPHMADTDKDGYSDCEEIITGSDPLDRQDISTTAILSSAIPFPRLSLSVGSLTFQTYQGGPDPSRVSVKATNTGGQVLTVTWKTSQPWLTAWHTCRLMDYGKPNCVMVGVNKTGLAAGHHTAVITVTGAQDSRTQGSPQLVSVDVWISGGSPILKIYLPLVVR